MSDKNKHWGKWVIRRIAVHPAPCYYVYSVWEPTNGPTGNHSTITTIGDKWYGRVGTRRLPSDIDAIPVGEKRFAAVAEHHKAQYDLSYDLIRMCFHNEIGDFSRCRFDMGEVSHS